MTLRPVLAAVLLALTWLAPAAAQTIVRSERPDHVALTVYRDSDREPGDAPEIGGWLRGYGLVTETRTISIPAGENVIRFEGVASGMFAETAIVAGLPERVLERNRDADLLSPASLLDRSLARRVHLRRTNLVTGAVREEEAVVRSGPAGALVVQTPAGFEALRCTGLPEALVYNEIPEGLSARPTFSVRARSAAPVTATVTLSYLAAGFDWQANYIATLSSDRRRLELFAWLTLASSDDTGFADAAVQAVAGQPNRPTRDAPRADVRQLRLRCWPSGRSHQIATQRFRPEEADETAIVVTGTRMRGFNLAALSPVTSVMAEQEDLGDLKLYRIPVPVTVAPRSQKQVALLTRAGVAVREVYRQTFNPGNVDEPEPANHVILTRNQTRDGLGLPLPAGRLILFGAGSDRPVMLGAAAVPDRAIGEEVTLDLGPAPGVLTELRRIDELASGGIVYELRVTNDSSRAIDFEARLSLNGIVANRRISISESGSMWRVRVRRNGTATLRFTAAN